MGEGQRVLDVACGPGTVTFLAAARVGPAGAVYGIDLSTGQLDHARLHRATDGWQNVIFREMDAEALEFAGATFDAVLCSFGIQFFPRADVFLAEVLRVLVPGGRIAVATWQRGEGVGMTGGPEVEAYLEGLGLQWAAPGRSLQQPGALETALTAAGFDRVVITSEQQLQQTSVKEHAQSVIHSLELRGSWAHLSEAQRLEVLEIVRRNVSGYEKNGGLHLPRVALIASGARPSP